MCCVMLWKGGVPQRVEKRPRNSSICHAIVEVERVMFRRVHVHQPGGAQEGAIRDTRGVPHARSAHTFPW
jgi:hypothetical protein